MTPEGAVKKEIDKVLDKYKPKLWYRKPVRTGMGKPVLDYHGCCNGAYFAIEAKAPGEKPTTQQQTTLNEILAAGGDVFVIDGTQNTTTYLELEHWVNQKL